MDTKDLAPEVKAHLEKLEKERDELQAKVDAEAGKKSSAVEESKALRDRLKAAEDKAKAYEEAEKKKAEEEAKKAGEWDKLKAEKDAENKALRDELVSTIKDSALTAGLAAAKVGAPYLTAAKAMLKDKVEVDDKNVATIDGKPVTEALKAWAESDEGKHFVLSGNNGGDAPGGGGGGDDDFDKMSVTQKALHIKALEAKDPKKAAELRKKVLTPG